MLERINENNTKWISVINPNILSKFEKKFNLTDSPKISEANTAKIYVMRLRNIKLFLRKNEGFCHKKTEKINRKSTTAQKANVLYAIKP